MCLSPRADCVGRTVCLDIPTIKHIGGYQLTDGYQMRDTPNSPWSRRQGLTELCWHTRPFCQLPSLTQTGPLLRHCASSSPKLPALQLAHTRCQRRGKPYLKRLCAWRSLHHVDIPASLSCFLDQAGMRTCTIAQVTSHQLILGQRSE